MATALQPGLFLMPKKLPLFPGTTSGISSYESGGSIPSSLPSASSPHFSPPCSLRAVGFIHSLPPGPCTHCWFPQLPEFQACVSQCLLDIPSRCPSSPKVASSHSGSFSHVLSVSEFTKARNLGVTVGFHPPLAAISYWLGMYFTAQVPPTSPPLHPYSLDFITVLKF